METRCLTFYSVVVNICICFTITLVSCYGQQWFYQHYLTDVYFAIAMSAKYTRQVRATVLDELNKDYVVGARARGIKEKQLSGHMF